MDPEVKGKPDRESSKMFLERLNLPATVADLQGTTTDPTTMSSSSSATPPDMNPFLKSTDDRKKCELCGKELKISELRLHMNVHYYEQSNKR